MKPKLVILLGPTAVGKSELALELADKINGAIVNADSQQVYRLLDIGTRSQNRPQSHQMDRDRLPRLAAAGSMASTVTASSPLDSACSSNC